MDFTSDQEISWFDNKDSNIFAFMRGNKAHLLDLNAGTHFESDISGSNPCIYKIFNSQQLLVRQNDEVLLQNIKTGKTQPIPLLNTTTASPVQNSEVWITPILKPGTNTAIYYKLFAPRFHCEGKDLHSEDSANESSKSAK